MSDKWKPTKREMRAFLDGYLAGHQRARNHALHEADDRRKYGGYDPKVDPGHVYRQIEQRTSDFCRDEAAEKSALAWAAVRP